MRAILGLDYGKKRVGVAVSDDQQRLAVPSATLVVETQEQLFADIEALVKEKDVEKVVVGLPLSLSGAASEQTKETQDFICALEEYLRLPVDFQDERMTSVQADTGGRDSRTRDARAATLMLQSYLDSKK